MKLSHSIGSKSTSAVQIPGINIRTSSISLVFSVNFEFASYSTGFHSTPQVKIPLLQRYTAAMAQLYDPDRVLPSIENPDNPLPSIEKPDTPLSSISSSLSSNQEEEPMPDKATSTSWVQKAQLQNELRGEARNSRLLRDEVHQQKRDMNLLNNQVEEYEEIIVDRETRARKNADKATNLREALTWERNLAQVNDNYMQGIERQCGELETANENLRQTSSKRERAFNRDMEDMEKRVQELEKELSKSSKNKAYLRQQIDQEMEDWRKLRFALEANDDVDIHRIEKLNRVMDRMSNMLNNPDMRRGVMTQSGTRPMDIRQVGQPPTLIPRACREVSMEDASEVFSSYRDAALRTSMSICSSDSEYHPPPVSGAVPMFGGSAQGPDRTEETAKGKGLEIMPPSNQAREGKARSTDIPLVMVQNEPGRPMKLDAPAPVEDVDMQSPTPTPVSAGFDPMQIDEDHSHQMEDINYHPGTWYGREPHDSPESSSMSLDDSDNDRDPLVPSSHPITQFPSRKRPRYKMSTDTSALSESESDNEPSSAVKRIKGCPACGHKMANDNGQVTLVDSSPQIVSPVIIHSVSPEPPRNEKHQTVLQDTQSQDQNRPHNYWHEVLMHELPIKSVATQTDALAASRGVQVGESLGTYLKKMEAPRSQKPGSSIGPLELALETRPLMPGTWPQQSVPDAAESDDSSAIAEFITRCERVGRPVGVWLLRICQAQPRELLLAMVGLVVVVYLLRGHRTFQWMSANDMPESVVRALRSNRVSEFRWMDSLSYGLMNRLDIDGVELG